MGVADERLQLSWNPQELRAEAALGESGSMQTAVAISVFTDGRASAEDAGVSEGDDLRGWWADHLADRPIGSKGWRRWRTPFTQELLRQEEQDTRDALVWLLEDGVAERIEVEADRIGRHRMCVRTDIYQPGDLAPRWSFAWEKPIVV